MLVVNKYRLRYTFLVFINVFILGKTKIAKQTMLEFLKGFYAKCVDGCS